MKKIILGICFLDEDDNILSKRTIEGNFTEDDEEQLNKKFSLSAKEQIAIMLADNLKMAVDKEVISEMLKETEV